MKKINRFIPVNIPKLYKAERKNINKCLKTNWISSEGKFVREFEAKFSKFNKRKYHCFKQNCCFRGNEIPNLKKFQ